MKLLITLLTLSTTTSPTLALSLPSLTHTLTQTSSIRSIKDLTSTFAHLSQLHSYTSISQLFTPNGTIHWGENFTISTPASIASFLQNNFTSNHPGALDTFVFATPLVNLGRDGKTAKGRYNGWRWQGDGRGGTWLEGGIWENEYRLWEGNWKVETMRYARLYEGGYEEGWRNVGGRDFGAVPEFHYTPDEAGIPIPYGAKDVEGGESWDVEELRGSVQTLNDEDDVRNLQHAWGYYLDRRMWDDVEDLFGKTRGWNGTFTVDNVGTWSGKRGVRAALQKWMGPKGLTQGVLNEHLIFNTMVSVREGGMFADSRGIEIALIGDRAQNKSEWRIGYFQNSFIKQNNTWQFLNVTIVPLVVANYSTGWGNRSLLPSPTTSPHLLSPARLPSTKPSQPSNTSTDLPSLSRSLNRSTAYDSAENIVNAYGFYIDFIDGAGCFNMSAVHHPQGHKASPFTGFYHTRQRVLDACTFTYGTKSIPTRSSISFHWRPQPVIFVSSDGRSASIKARLLQPATAKGVGSAQIRGGMYHDQAVLSADGTWKLWSVTIDEFYWNTGRWASGWNGVEPRAANATNPGPRDLTKEFPPDLLLTEMGERERGFQGGTGRFTAWPDILKMWFGYRNPVSGRVPESENDGYWPGCVPCRDRREWGLERNGWEEPPTGPRV